LRLATANCIFSPAALNLALSDHTTGSALPPSVPGPKACHGKVEIMATTAAFFATSSLLNGASPLTTAPIFPKELAITVKAL
jgi:hypothetical protein